MAGGVVEEGPWQNTRIETIAIKMTQKMLGGCNYLISSNVLVRVQILF